MNGLAKYKELDTTNNDGLIIEHAELVKRIAYHLMNRLPENVQVDDLIQAGMIGLLEASRHYDASQGASFETYAGIRIRGAMIDEIRRLDWTPRSVHKKGRMVADAIQKIENETGRDARANEVAELLEIELDEYNQILRDSGNSRIFSIEELTQGGDQFLEEFAEADSAPIDRLTRERFKSALATEISGLPERERLVVSLYYDDELNLREIGKVIGVSESRVSQINSQAMLRLRARLAEWLDKDSRPSKE
ncbi:MAG: RNA polymerase sigma factor FliA [Methylococcales bacterium]